MRISLWDGVVLKIQSILFFNISVFVSLILWNINDVKKPSSCCGVFSWWLVLSVWLLVFCCCCCCRFLSNFAVESKVNWLRDHLHFTPQTSDFIANYPVKTVNVSCKFVFVATQIARAALCRCHSFTLRADKKQISNREHVYICVSRLACQLTNKLLHTIIKRNAFHNLKIC